MAGTGGRSPNKTRRAAGKKAALAEQKSGTKKPSSRAATGGDLFVKHLRRMVTSRHAKGAVADAPTMGAASLDASHRLLWAQLVDASEMFNSLHKAYCETTGESAATAAGMFDVDTLTDLFAAQTELMKLTARLAPQITKINKTWLDFELDSDGSEVTIVSDDFHSLMGQYSSMMQAVLRKLGPEKYAEVMTEVSEAQRAEANAATVH